MKLGRQTGYLGLFWIFCVGTAAPAREVTLPPADEISSQGSYGYCGLYAMTSFLELYAKSQHPDKHVHQLDPAYLATAYNSEIGSGTGGTNTDDLMYLTQKYGTLPMGAKPSGDVAFQWPMKDWAEAHSTLMPHKEVTGILDADYHHEKYSGHFTGKQFFDDNIGIKFNEWSGYFSSYKEKCEPSDNDDKRYFRGKDYDEVKKATIDQREKLGMKFEEYKDDPELLYTLLIAQLYTKVPALISIRTGLIKNFGSQVLLTADNLKDFEKGGCGTHIGVAVGHCHKKNSATGLCQRFEKALTEQKAPTDCIVFQNSWGTHSNEKGYVCLTKSALKRVMKAVFMLKGFY